jgi:histidyl-tRNA synthetase
MDNSQPQRIEPRTLKGFRDFLPERMIPRERMIDTARQVYRSFGFSPIDTPALEYLEILTGKGGEETDRQLYRFQDHGGRDVGLRFDLTIPLARFVAQHIHSLGLPFKRYHIATVWRGENTQRGRYREFMQCDFDTIGSLSVATDIETGLVIHDLLVAFKFEHFTIRLNNREVLNGLLDKLGLAERATLILRSLDKLSRIGPEKVAAEMAATAGTSDEQTAGVLKLSRLSGSNDQVLKDLAPLVAGNEVGERGLERLAQILSGLKAAGVPESRVLLDVSIARGLDYYTGAIYEAFLDDLPGIGSICSGGRYDNLAELYTRQQLPGIGASLGLDRLLAAMEELGMIETVGTPADVLVTCFDSEQLESYLPIASLLRAAGIAVELYPDGKKLGQQLKYADQRGYRLAIIAGPDELAENACQVKDLRSGESSQLSLDQDGRELVDHIRGLLDD